MEWDVQDGTMTLIAHDQFAPRSGLFDESHVLWRRNALLQQMVDATERGAQRAGKAQRRRRHAILETYSASITWHSIQIDIKCMIWLIKKSPVRSPTPAMNSPAFRPPTSQKNQLCGTWILETTLVNLCTHRAPTVPDDSVSRHGQAC